MMKIGIVAVLVLVLGASVSYAQFWSFSRTARFSVVGTQQFADSAHPGSVHVMQDNKYLTCYMVIATDQGALSVTPIGC